MLIVSFSDSLVPEKINYSFGLACHKSISDGLNVTTILLEIINIINALETGCECDEMLIKCSPPESSQSMCEKTGLFREEYKLKIEEFSKIPVSRFLFDHKFKSENETGFALELMCLDRETSKKITEMTKQHGLRVTSFYQSVLFFALKKLYTENDLQLPLSLPMFFTLSLRLRFEKIFELYNCRYYTAFFPLSFKQEFDSIEDFWPIARNIHDMSYDYLDPHKAAIFAVTHNFKAHDYFNKLYY